MNLDPKDNCVCGHTLELHSLGGNWEGYCLLCFGAELDEDNGRHKFHLNNLDYIEKLAKKRKLI